MAYPDIFARPICWF